MVQGINADKCKRHKLVKLAMRMFGFGSKFKTKVEPLDDVSIFKSKDNEDLKKRKFLEWQLKTTAGLSKQEGALDGLWYVGNNTWRFNPSFGHIKEFVVLKDMTQRHQPHIRYGKVNDEWVKLEHKGYYILENQEG